MSTDIIEFILELFSDVIEGNVKSSRGQSDLNNQKLKIEETDIVIESAIKEAKRTLLDFLEFYNNAPSNTNDYRVKVDFSDMCGSEQIWVTNIKYNKKSQTVEGILASEPQTINCISVGEKVNVLINDIADWAFECGGLQYGSFTVYAVLSQKDITELNNSVKYYGFVNNPLEKPGVSFAELIKDLPIDKG